MPFSTFPRGTPSSQGVEPAALKAFLDAMEAHPQVEMHSLMVVRNAHVVAEGWWRPYSPDRLHLLYSVSKSFTATAAGLAVAEGLLDPDRTVLSYFPELDAEITDRRSRSMLVRHLAAMASGHEADTWDRAVERDPTDPVRGFLLLPPEHEPGSWFAYNQPCSYSLAAIIQRQSGQTLIDYLRPRLFDPLDIGPVSWQQHPPGRALGFSGMFATTETVAKLGQLYLQRGWWSDRQLLPTAWVEAATTKQVDNPREDNPDWRQGYGFQFWMARHGYRGDGAYGQFCVVLPEQQTVIAITGASVDMQAVLDAVWSLLLPALSDDHHASPDRTAADLHLARRMSALQLTPAIGKPEPRSEPERWDGTVFTPAGGRCDQQPTLQALTVSRAVDGWQVIVDEPGHRLGGALGVGCWQVSDRQRVPVAISGGWDDGQLRIELLFLETPHRLALSCELADASFTATWGTVPLHAGTLSELHAPGRSEDV